jgi:hypothetical protein
MLVFTALMMASPSVVSLAFPPSFDETSSLPPASMLVGLGLAVVFAVLAHLDYRFARRAIAADGTLRGAWLVENAWWLVYAVLMVAGLFVALVLAMA